MKIHQKGPISVFLSYADEDQPLLQDLEKHLSTLQKQGLISIWHHQLVVPGTNRAETMNQQFEQASIILLLVSAPFLASDYCYEIEILRALERHKAGQVRVVPIIMRPVDWTDSPIAHLQALPTGAKPITKWDNQDEALVDVIVGIRQIIKDLSLPLQTSFRSLPSIWNVPFRQNPFFTGRADILNGLYEAFQVERTATVTQAMSGLGGVGKTQIAVEYAYRYGHEYQAILWVKADSPEILTSEFINIAYLLDLPQKNEQDQNEIMKAVKRWLQTHIEWLLIFDNVEDIDTIDHFLPRYGSGHILLTTRLQAIGAVTAYRTEIKRLGIEEGTFLLLRRAKLITPGAPLTQASGTHQALAREISIETDGLPLALDQAAAYIEETRCGLSEYLDLYRKRRAELLGYRGSHPGTSGHPESVITTFSLSFKRIQEVNTLSVDILRLCAFFYHENIPEQLFSPCVPLLVSGAVDQIALNKALGELLKYSLLYRAPEMKMVTIHRLVQVVIIDEMSECEQHIWAGYAVKAIGNTKFDMGKDWHNYQLYLPHLQICTSWVEQWGMTSKEAADILNNVATFLGLSSRYDQARGLLEKSQDICEKLLKDQKDTSPTEIRRLAAILFNRATLEHDVGQYEQAAALFLRARLMIETVASEQDLLSLILVGLARTSHSQSKYDEAEALYQQARIIAEKIGEAQSSAIVPVLSDLAQFYKEQGEYVKAGEFYQRAQVILEKEWQSHHPMMAGILHNRARLCFERKEYVEAELLLKQALQISEAVWGPEHSQVAYSFNHLGDLYRELHKYDKAEQYFQQALKIGRKIWGREHLLIGSILNNLGLLYVDCRRYIEAEQLYLQALAIDESLSGPENIHAAVVLANLGALYTDQGAYARAEPFLQRAYAIVKSLTPGHPRTINCLAALCNAYFQQKKYRQMILLLQQEQPVIANLLQSDIEVDMATMLNDVLFLLQSTFPVNQTTQQKGAQKKRLNKRKIRRRR